MIQDQSSNKIQDVFTCLGCKRRMERMYSTRSDKVLKEEGHVFMCVHCGTLMAYKSERVEIASEEDIESLPEKIKNEALNYQVFLSKNSGVTANLMS
jgi:hypothetical protein